MAYHVEYWRRALHPAWLVALPCEPGASISINHWHGDQLSAKDFLAEFVLAGPNTLGPDRARDFVWCGVMGRPHRQRLFSAPALGVDLHAGSREGVGDELGDGLADGHCRGGRALGAAGTDRRHSARMGSRDVANQRRDTRRLVRRITNLDVCGLVPIWMFFAPNLATPTCISCFATATRTAGSRVGVRSSSRAAGGSWMSGARSGASTRPSSTSHTTWPVPTT